MAIDNSEVYAYVDRIDLLQACDNAKNAIIDEIMNVAIEDGVKEYYYKRVESIGKEYENRTWFQKLFRIQPYCLKEKFKELDFEELSISEIISFYEEYHNENRTFMRYDLEKYYKNNRKKIDAIGTACRNTNEKKILVNINTLNYLDGCFPNGYSSI